VTIAVATAHHKQVAAFKSINQSINQSINGGTHYFVTIVTLLMNE